MFISDIEKKMYDSFEKKVVVVDKQGIKHKTFCRMFTSRFDEDRGVSSIALKDGSWLYEDQIESIEILDDNEE